MTKRGRELSLGTTAGLIVGLGGKVALGTETRGMRSYPFLRVDLLHNQTREGLSPIIGVLALFGGRTYEYTESRGDTRGDQDGYNYEFAAAAVGGPVFGQGDSMRGNERPFGIAVGAGVSVHNASTVLRLEIPWFLWPFPTSTERRFRRLVIVERELVAALQASDFDRAGTLLAELRVGTANLKQLIQRYGDAIEPIGLSEFHPLSSTERLRAAPVTTRFRRLLRNCATRLGYGY